MGIDPCCLTGGTAPWVVFVLWNATPTQQQNLLVRSGSLHVPATQEVIEPPDVCAAATVPRLPWLVSKRR